MRDLAGFAQLAGSRASARAAALPHLFMPTLQPIFHPSSSTDLLSCRDLRLSSDGVATLTAVAVSAADIGVCSVLIGADCHTRHVTCCYCLDEIVAGALFDARRERVVTWSPHESGFLALHVFGLGDLAVATSCALLRRFTVSHIPGEKLQRIEWAADRILLWIGDAGQTWTLSVYDTRANGRPDEEQPEQTIGASGLGRHWGVAVRSKAAAFLPLNECSLSADASWALAVAADGVWSAIHLSAANVSSHSIVRLEERVIAACFAPPSSSASGCAIFVLTREGGDADILTLQIGSLIAGESGIVAASTLTAPWLSTLALPSGAHSLSMSVRLSEDDSSPLALWVHTRSRADGSHSIHGAADDSIKEETLLRRQVPLQRLYLYRRAGGRGHSARAQEESREAALP